MCQRPEGDAIRGGSRSVEKPLEGFSTWDVFALSLDRQCGELVVCLVVSLSSEEKKWWFLEGFL